MGDWRRNRDQSPRLLKLYELFLGEDFFQQRSGLGGGIGANFYFFLSKHVEDTVEGLADDELVEIELVGDGIAAGGRLDDVLIFLDDADALQGAVNDGSERACEIGGAGSLEVLGGSGGAAGKDASGVVDIHSLESFEENGFGLRSRALGGAVHVDFEIVDDVTLADQAHSFAHGLKFGGKKDANGFIVQEPVGPASERNGLAGAEFENLFESCNDFLVGERGWVMVIRRFSDLGCGTYAAAKD